VEEIRTSQFDNEQLSFENNNDPHKLPPSGKHNHSHDQHIRSHADIKRKV